MYIKLAERLAVVQGTEGHSAAVPMAGANAARIGATMINLNGATNTAFSLQGSQDLANWEDITGTLTLTAAGAGSVSVTGITFTYVRVKYATAGGGTTTIVACDLNTSMQ